MLGSRLRVRFRAALCGFSSQHATAEEPQCFEAYCAGPGKARGKEGDNKHKVLFKALEPGVLPTYISHG